MIAFICHPFHRGGVTDWMMEGFLELQKRNYTSYFITVQPTHGFFGKDRPLMLDIVGQKNNNKDLFSEKAGTSFELGNNSYKALRYANIIKKNVPKGAVLIPSDDEALWQACTYLARDYKTIGVLHSDEAYYYTLLKKYSPYLSGYVSVSNRVADNAKNEAGSIEIENRVIPCGIDISQFTPGRVKKNMILWVGRLEKRQKRVLDVIPIAKSLKEKNVSFTIRVYGTGDQFETLQEQVKENALEREIELMGWRSKKEISDALSEAKVLLQTSNFEGMSVAVMEGLASGCEVVSTRVSGVEDLENDMEAKKVVRLYETGNTEEAAKLLVDCLHDESAETANIAVATAKKYYGIESCMNAYIEFGEEIKKSSVHYKINFPAYKSLQSMLVGQIRYIKWKLRNLNLFCAG